MEKVLRRTALAKSQAKRKARIITEKTTTRDRVQYRMQAGAILREEQAAIKEARHARRQDWELGRLAPWRDFAFSKHPAPASTEAKEGGKAEAKENGMMTSSYSYGTFNVRKLNPPKVPEAYRVKDWFIREGDRVVCVDGREGVKGRIGKVKSLDKETETVTVEGVNLIEVRVPSAMLQPGQSPIHTIEAPLPLSTLRLVYPLPDPNTGVPRDVILTNLVKTDSHFNLYENEKVWTRVLMPQNIIIPWPEKDDSGHQDEDIDTLRIDVENATFLPTLLRPPMPMGVIDELRNKYSRLRDRHDDEWVAMKEAEDDEAKRIADLSKRMMPRGAKNIARVHPSSSGGTFMTSKKAQIKNKALEALGRHMAAKGLGKPSIFQPGPEG